MSILECIVADKDIAFVLKPNIYMEIPVLMCVSKTMRSSDITSLEMFHARAAELKGRTAERNEMVRAQNTLRWRLSIGILTGDLAIADAVTTCVSMTMDINSTTKEITLLLRHFACVACNLAAFCDTTLLQTHTTQLDGTYENAIRKGACTLLEMHETIANTIDYAVSANNIA